MKSFIQALKKYAVFDGRARRREFWMFTLFTVILGFAIGLMASFIEVLGIGKDLFEPIHITYGAVMFVPGVAVGVRRMHDIGRSGWWLLIPLVSLVFLCLDSQLGENKYGSNPKDDLAGIQPNLGEI